MLPYHIRSLCVKWLVHNYRDPPAKFASCLSSCSRSLKSTRVDQLPGFLLMFCRNYGPISYCFRDKGQYLQNFPTPKYPIEGVPSKFVMVVGSKTRIMPLSDHWKVWRHIHSFRHNTGIGQTDNRQKCHNNIKLCMHTVLMCDEKDKKHYSPRECSPVIRGAQNSFSFSLYHMLSTLKISSQTVLNFLNYRVHIQSSLMAITQTVKYSISSNE